jgi:hypothetical protein
VYLARELRISVLTSKVNFFTKKYIESDFLFHVGSLNVGIVLKKWDSEHTQNKVINLEKCNKEELIKLKDSFKDSFELRYEELEYMGEVKNNYNVITF